MQSDSVRVRDLRCEADECRAVLALDLPAAEQHARAAWQAENRARFDVDGMGRSRTAHEDLIELSRLSNEAREAASKIRAAQYEAARRLPIVEGELFCDKNRAEAVEQLRTLTKARIEQVAEVTSDERLSAEIDEELRVLAERRDGVLDAHAAADAASRKAGKALGPSSELRQLDEQRETLENTRTWAMNAAAAARSIIVRIEADIVVTQRQFSVATLYQAERDWLRASEAIFPAAARLLAARRAGDFLGDLHHCVVKPSDAAIDAAVVALNVEATPLTKVTEAPESNEQTAAA